MWPYILKPNQDHEDKKKKMCCCFIWHISQTVNLFTSTKRQKHFTVSFTLQSVEVLFQACLNVHLLLFNWRFSCFQRSHVSWCFSCFHQRTGGDEDRLISPENCFRTHSEDCSRRPAATVVTKQLLFQLPFFRSRICQIKSNKIRINFAKWVKSWTVQGKAQRPFSSLFFSSCALRLTANQSDFSHWWPRRWLIGWPLPCSIRAITLELLSLLSQTGACTRGGLVVAPPAPEIGLATLKCDGLSAQWEAGRQLEPTVGGVLLNMRCFLFECSCDLFLRTKEARELHIILIWRHSLCCVVIGQAVSLSNTNKHGNVGNCQTL